MEKQSYSELSARERIKALVHPACFEEYYPPTMRMMSPHLSSLDLPQAFDDGIIIGKTSLHDKTIFIAAQEAGFMGGTVGEVHGAKLTGLCLKAAIEKPAAVILLLDSGGVRLQEANAGEIAIAELITAIFSARAAGVITIGFVGGKNGAFGGIGIVAACLDHLLMNERGRTGISGPEVIETMVGVNEYNAEDRALVWRTCGGKHRALMGDAHYIADHIPTIRHGLLSLLKKPTCLTIDKLHAQQNVLLSRYHLFKHITDSRIIWQALGVATPDQIPEMNDELFLQALASVDHSHTIQATSTFRSLSAKSMGPIDKPRNVDLKIHCKQPLAKIKNSPITERMPEYPVPQPIEPTLQTVLIQLCDHYTGYQHSNMYLGEACIKKQPCQILALCNEQPIGIESCLWLADKLLAILSSLPPQPLVLCLNTGGQCVNRQAELLGLNRYFAHLISCFQLARKRGFPLTTLLYGSALGGALIATGLNADHFFSLPDTKIAVMWLEAMSRVTKIPLKKLQLLSQTSVIFSPGPEHYERLGMIDMIATVAELKENIVASWSTPPDIHQWRKAGEKRHGRYLAYTIVKTLCNGQEE